MNGKFPEHRISIAETNDFVLSSHKRHMHISRVILIDSKNHQTQIQLFILW